MKRHIRAFALCLLVGATLTYLVAWTLAVTVDVYSTQPKSGLSPYGDWHWSITRFDGLGSMRIESAWRLQENPGRTAIPPDEFAPRWSGLHEPPPDGFVYGDRLIDARGWPWIALSCDVTRYMVRGPADSGVQHLVYGLPTPLPDWNQMRAFPAAPARATPRVLPYRPVWGGFIANTLLYALSLWIAFVVRPGVIAWRRKRRGLCEKCAYPVSTSPVCTECGAAVKCVV